MFCATAVVMSVVVVFAKAVSTYITVACSASACSTCVTA